MNPASDVAYRPSCKSVNGFTLIEMITTLVLLSIIAVSALPRFFDFSIYRERALFDDTLNALRYAQKLAVATGCNVQFKSNANQFVINRPGSRVQCASTNPGDFTLTVPRPGSGHSSYQGSETGVSISDAILYFDAKGTASSNLTINVGNRNITVVRDTGFVYDSTP